ncbi:hypothetical protein Pcaca05_05480 [Pectobacterium carotovorum subsp. carotovorum]|nr:hypothetical protein Pcaca05_05480 [Pectobacterium carotovorum subsp. carotovorum]
MGGVNNLIYIFHCKSYISMISKVIYFFAWWDFGNKKPAEAGWGGCLMGFIDGSGSLSTKRRNP